MDLVIKKSYRARRARITVYHDGRVLITVPFFCGAKFVEKFINSKKNWIESKLAYFKRRGPIVKLEGGIVEYKKVKKQSLDFVKRRLEDINKLYNLRYNKVCIRNQKSRWGSCSKNGNLNFHYKIIHLPANLADYLIVHELCHLQEFNHSKKFWELVSKAVPNYKKLKKDLRNIF